jgi:hypothetical protein
MRRFIRVGGAIALVVASAITATVIWVDKALASTLKHPEILCLRPEDRTMIALDAFPEERQDYLVSKAINFRLGVPRMFGGTCAVRPSS